MGGVWCRSLNREIEPLDDDGSECDYCKHRREHTCKIAGLVIGDNVIRAKMLVDPETGEDLGCFGDWEYEYHHALKSWILGTTFVPEGYKNSPEKWRENSGRWRVS